MEEASIGTGTYSDIVMKEEGEGMDFIYISDASPCVY